jgi:nucleotide-binding universal stress UspA family protein
LAIPAYQDHLLNITAGLTSQSQPKSMKKIILALDGEHFPKGAFELAAFLNQKEAVLVTGVFLSPIDVSKIVAYTGLEAVPLMPSLTDGDYSEQVQQNIDLFRNKCVAEGMEFRIHNDSDNLPLASLIKESRFADLLFVSRESFFSNISKEQPNEYMQELLKKTECPVVVVPENFKAPEKVIVLYDGEASSAFALKQFAYLFPSFSNLPVTLTEVTASPNENLPDQDAVAELAARHFSDLTLNEVAMENKKYFTTWLSEHEKTWVVMGAYGRSLLSTLFKKSFADEVIKNVELPLFIAHK